MISRSPIAGLGFIKLRGALLTATDITTVATDKALGAITIPSLTAFTIKAAYAGISWQQVLGGAGNCYLVDTQNIQVDTSSGGWLTAIANVERIKHWAATTVYQINGGEVIGATDIKAKCVMGAATDFQWDEAKADSATLQYLGLQPVLILVVG